MYTELGRGRRSRITKECWPSLKEEKQRKAMKERGGLLPSISVIDIPLSAQAISSMTN